MPDTRRGKRARASGDEGGAQGGHKKPKVDSPIPRQTANTKTANSNAKVEQKQDITSSISEAAYTEDYYELNFDVDIDFESEKEDQDLKSHAEIKNTATAAITSGNGGQGDSGDDQHASISGSEHPEESTAAPTTQGQSENDSVEPVDVSTLPDYFSKNPVEDKARWAMYYSMDSVLRNNPSITSALGLRKISDSVKVEVRTNGVKYEVMWKITGTYDEPTGIDLKYQRALAQESVRKTVPQSIKAVKLVVDKGNENTGIAPAENTQSHEAVNSSQHHEPLKNETPSPAPQKAIINADTPPCKFGKKCARRDTCTYDHQGICMHVNTPKGCTQGKTCSYSHRYENRECLVSKYRNRCRNGPQCFYKHEDDLQAYHPGQMIIPGISSEAIKAAQQLAIATETSSEPAVGPSDGTNALKRGASEMVKAGNTGQDQLGQPAQKKLHTSPSQPAWQTHGIRGRGGAMQRGGRRGNGRGGRGRGRGY